MCPTDPLPDRVKPTYHLAPVEHWAAADPSGPILAPSLEDEGFIHCTTGADELVATANRHYREDPRPFVALVVDLDLLTSPWRTDDARGIYPHIYGPIDRVAILSSQPIPRGPDGAFLALER